MKCVIPLLIAAAWLGQATRAIAADEPRGDKSGPQASLPLTEVVLYSSGVGYFRREGRVEGAAKVDLRFKVDDINDLLKSLIVQDLDGGRVDAVTPTAPATRSPRRSRASAST